MQDHRTILSVIYPTFQEERVLARTLEQFTPELKQQFGIEVIVSDGGSTDATLTIARQYAEKVVEADVTIPQTIALGRNDGAKVAQGDILIYFDADVLIEDLTLFFRTISNVMQNPDIVALTCNVRVYDSEERFSDLIFHQFYNYYFYFLNVIGIGMGRGECQVIRKTMFEEIGGYSEYMAAGEDFDIFTRLKKRGRIWFAHSLTVRESPRRFRKYGYLYLSSLWFMNALSVWLFHKPVVRQWKAVR
jgi:glycosyltransferase involved in cell wall biosynthesis